MLAGISLGFILRAHPFKRINHLITLLIWILLFMLGVTIGGNNTIFNSLATIGIQAFVIGTATTIGSAAASWLLWKHIKRNEA